MYTIWTMIHTGSTGIPVSINRYQNADKQYNIQNGKHVDLVQSGARGGNKPINLSIEWPITQIILQNIKNDNAWIQEHQSKI